MNTNLLSQFVQSHLEQRDLNFRREAGATPDRSIFKMECGYDNGDQQVVIVVDDDKNFVTCFSYVPFRISKDRRADVGEFLHRVNYERRFGAFEIDVTDGEVRYRTSLAVTDGVVTDKMLAFVIGPCLETCDRYLPGICAVAFGDVPASEAVRNCEESDKEEGSDPGETQASEELDDDSVPTGTTIH